MEQQTFELEEAKGQSRRGAQTSSSGSSTLPMPPAVAGPRGARRADSPGTKDTAARGPSGRTDPGAQQLPPMRAPDGRRSPSAAPPGSRHPAAARRGHRVSVAHPALRSCDRLTAAGWPEGVSRHSSVQAWVSLLAGAYRLSKRNIRALYVRRTSASRCRWVPSANWIGRWPRPWRVRSARFVRRQGIVMADRLAAGRAKAFVDRGDGSPCSPSAKDQPRASMRVRITGRWSAAIAHRICRCDAGKSAGLICGAPSRSSWPGAERPSASVTTCWSSEQLFTWWHSWGPLPRPYRRFVSALSVSFVLWAAFRRRQDGGHLRQSLRPRLKSPVDLRTPAGVEPTNNEAERALRHGVLWRHTSFGTHSAEGSRFVEPLTVREPCGNSATSSTISGWPVTRPCLSSGALAAACQSLIPTCDHFRELNGYEESEAAAASRRVCGTQFCSYL